MDELLLTWRAGKKEREEAIGNLDDTSQVFALMTAHSSNTAVCLHEVCKQKVFLKRQIMSRVQIGLMQLDCDVLIV